MLEFGPMAHAHLFKHDFTYNKYCLEICSTGYLHCYVINLTNKDNNM